MTENKFTKADALLDLTLATIKYNPETWNQGNWRCNTGMCFAGHAVVLAGYKWAKGANHHNSEYVLDPEHGEHWMDMETGDLINDPLKSFKGSFEITQGLLAEGRELSPYRLQNLANTARALAGFKDNVERYKRVSPAWAVAARELIVPDTANLFGASNDIGTLERMVGEIKAERSAAGAAAAAVRNSRLDSRGGAVRGCDCPPCEDKRKKADDEAAE